MKQEDERRCLNKKDRGRRRFNRFTRVYAVIYLILLLIFEFILLALDVLPGKYLLTLDLILGATSALIFWQLFSCKRMHRAKVLATAGALILSIVFVSGTAYMISTLAFLGKVSNDEENKDAVEVTERPFNLYITGDDSWGPVGSEEGRSDVNMIVTVNPKAHTVLLTSIPRDYQIRLMKHGKAMDKLTHTGFYGVDDSITSLEDLLDMNINYYVRVNFDTILHFVDAIGGVDVMSDYDFYSHYGGDDVNYHFKKGRNHLNGAQALAFARERHSFLDGDRQRVRDQQLVFQAMLEKATSSSTMVTKYNSILGNMSDSFEMNMTSREIRALMKMQINDMPSWTIKRNSITGGDAMLKTYSAGMAYVMTQDKTSMKKAETLINETMHASDNTLSSSVQNIHNVYKVMGVQITEQNEEKNAEA